jgi:uncharacterized protein YacL
VELIILRSLFFLVTIGLGVSLMLNGLVNWWAVPLAAIGAVALILLDVFLPRKRIELISSIYFGTAIGIFLTYVIGLALAPIWGSDTQTPLGQARNVILPLIGVASCYLCISLLWQTRDDFRFVIPYVEFAREVRGGKPYILDTSVVIDGRIADIVDTGIIDNQLIMPRFVLQELQSIADSTDKMRRSRGRRGLDVLNRLRANPKVELTIYDRETAEMDGQPVDAKLMLLARSLQGKIVTGDFNLNKVARLQNIPVINLNDIANSLKPVYLPGETLTVRIVKPGEESSQGIGYLEDGTMIVIEEGRPHIGKTVTSTVTSTLQTSAGRMIFGRFEGVVA